MFSEMGIRGGKRDRPREGVICCFALTLIFPHACLGRPITGWSFGYTSFGLLTQENAYIRAEVVMYTRTLGRLLCAVFGM
jgi:hypothetical protein